MISHQEATTKAKGTTMEAIARHDMVVVKNVHTMEGITYAEMDISGFEGYVHAPQVIEIDKKLLGKSGWNSDRNICYYMDKFVTFGKKRLSK
jgi:hypothetical protein